jgi:formate-dependent nitrite reductase membrane component NrfD
VNVFEVVGIVLILWAVLVGFLGISRENFPATEGAERIVGAISVILVLAAISAAVYTGIHEASEESESGAVPTATV